VRSDNGPQFSSNEFAVFAKLYNFTHTTSSPLYPQSNGQAERAVQTLKKILCQSEDVCQGLLSYRTTPMPWCNLSPAELLMGRKLRSLLPMTDQQLIPQWPYLPEFKRTNQLFKNNQKRNFDKHYRTSECPTLPNNSEVWVTSGREPVRGRVVAAADTPRSYLVNTPSGVIRRNNNTFGQSQTVVAATLVRIQLKKVDVKMLCQTVIGLRYQLGQMLRRIHQLVMEAQDPEPQLGHRQAPPLCRRIGTGLRREMW